VSKLAATRGFPGGRTTGAAAAAAPTDLRLFPVCRIAQGDGKVRGQFLEPAGSGRGGVSRHQPTFGTTAEQRHWGLRDAPQPRADHRKGCGVRGAHREPASDVGELSELVVCAQEGQGGGFGAADATYVFVGMNTTP
jgi:hypothetical protein